MIIQGTETLTSLIHILSECLLTPVVILLVISIIIVILAFGGMINEYISRFYRDKENFPCAERCPVSVQPCSHEQYHKKL